MDQSATVPNILILHGPNLNLLGCREPDQYGNVSLAALNAQLIAQAAQHGGRVRCIQSNAEHVLIEQVHAAAGDGTQFIVINPAAFTHTSVALRDALAAVAIPFIEVHISNVFARERFRQHSFFSDQAVGVVCGLGLHGYRYALDYIFTHLARGLNHGET